MTTNNDSLLQSVPLIVKTQLVPCVFNVYNDALSRVEIFKHNAFGWSTLKCACHASNHPLTLNK